MANEKLKWETPELVSLNKNITRGFCLPGSGDTDVCANGTSAAGTGCSTGTGGATPSCSPGTGGT